MGLLICVLSGFALALVAPWIVRFGGKWGSWALALLPAGIAVYLASHLPALSAGDAAVRADYPWAPGLGLRLSLYLDGLSLLFALLISGIGALIVVYAGGYLAGHRHLGRLQAYLLMFMASMLGLVMADNILALFVFWELTSISSYLLIGFDHHRLKARKAALQALLVTGSGGLALLAGLLLMGHVAGEVMPGDGPMYELTALLSNPEAVAALREHTLYLPIVILVLAGAFTKSAQFPFHFWLPSAMEAPTPVSAYLHSSTMVKAGVYLMARMDPALGDTAIWTTALVGFGATTMLVGVILAFRETYFKRILAYTTVSALGVITMAIGLGSPAAVIAGLVFLLTHALYKGAMFMLAGSIDHATGIRDTEQMGGLARKMPALAVAGGLAGLSMAGVPPLIGFISKEMLLEAVLHGALWPLPLAIAITIMAALTVALAIIAGIKPFFLRPAIAGGPALEDVAEGDAGPKQDEAPAPLRLPLSLLLGPVLLALTGFAIAVAPQLAIVPLIGAASSAVSGEPAEVKIVFWHGLTLALGLSGIALIGGMTLYRFRLSARRALSFVDVLARVGPARMYEWSLAGLNTVATAQTRLLQHGYLRFYLLVVVATGVLLVGVTLVVKDGLPRGTGLGELREIRFYEAGLAVLIAIGAVFAAVARRRLAAIAALGLVGLMVALVFVAFGAPDLAMTQLSVETLGIILFLLVFYHLPDFRSLSTMGTRVRDMIIAAAGGAVMTGLVLLTAELSTEPVVSDYYAQNAAPLAFGRNVVNVILVDFRAIDTLGELTVIAIAAIGVFALLKMPPESER